MCGASQVVAVCTLYTVRIQFQVEMKIELAAVVVYIAIAIERILFVR